MNLKRLRDFATQKLSVKRKSQARHFLTVCSIKNLFFLLTTELENGKIVGQE
jgi:hypothetical protein